MFSRLQHPFTCLLFADAHSWNNLSQWDTAVPQESLYFQRNWVVIATHCDCVSISELLTISWVQNRRSHEGSKVVVLLPFSVWLSAIHNQEIQQPLYLKKNIHIYIDIFIFCILFLAAVVPGASESQLSASGVSYMEDLCKENFHELFGINKVFLKVP